MKIFYQLGKYKNLTTTRGDFITEINTIKAINKFAEVGNNVNEKYDLYYVRNNPRLFMKLPQPKIYFASPYYEPAHQCAKAIITFTDAWTQCLKSGIPIGTSGTTPNNNVITIHQTIDSNFKPLKTHPRTLRIRRRIGGDFIIGHFGAVRESNYPYSFLHILPRLIKKYPNIRVMFAGQNVKPLSGAVPIMRTNFEYSDMPYAISACDLILYNFRTDDGHIVGSMKLLEAMACGVPILSPRFQAREEELGKNYKLFYPYTYSTGRFSSGIEEQMYRIIERFINSNYWHRRRISNDLIDKSKFYMVDESAKRIKKIFKGLM